MAVSLNPSKSDSFECEFLDMPIPGEYASNTGWKCAKKSWTHVALADQALQIIQVFAFFQKVQTCLNLWGIIAEETTSSQEVN